MAWISNYSLIAKLNSRLLTLKNLKKLLVVVLENSGYPIPRIISLRNLKDIGQKRRTQRPYREAYIRNVMKLWCSMIMHRWSCPQVNSPKNLLIH
ncbi:hypothetical protein SAMN04488523_11556 [Sulfitobacter brevis]|uniref:Uncharacterized protein n=1 Tax=Sulfitobacter brevis TaxID=74348 RepID=A0A1I2FCC2_9RHOB|nr:hypothetical protein SAMN04488523_11556 [Sulfitobacter brevis]